MIRINDPNRLWEVSNAAQNAAKSALYGISGQPLDQAISYAIAQGVDAAIKKLLEIQYTDEDFEKDIQLRS